MWNALRTDLSEFVTTVKSETTEALNQIDANFPDASDNNDRPTAADEEALRRMALEETYTTPLVEEEEESEESVEGKEAKNDSAGNDEGAVAQGKKESDGTSEDQPPQKEGSKEKPADDHATSNGGDSADDDDEYEADAKEFMAVFSIDEKTDEISELLDLYPDTLKAHFENLVPTTVTYEDFWMRYFYRCDADRIQAEWDAEDEAIQRARAQAVQQGISTVKNLLGGAVKAVRSTAGGASAGGTKAYFGASGRPPFVMNTAVSEDDFDGEEEEEELGWDEDSDEEGFESNDGAENEEEEAEQIVFKDPAVEKLQEELQQALAERDVLQQTVELQKKELAALKEGKTDSEEVEQLKTKLFEKESEVAAIRASMSDESHDQGDAAGEEKVAALKDEIELLEKKVAASESARSEAVLKYEKTVAELERVKSELMKKNQSLESATNQNENTAEEIAQLKKFIAELEHSNEQQKSENAKLKEALQASQAKEKQGESSLTALSVLQAELEQTKLALSASQEEKLQLETELENAKETLRHKEEALSVDSPDTGIKIEPPAIENLTEEEAVEDGWDDDW